MEPVAFYTLVAGSVFVLIAGFMRPNGYMQLPFLTAAVYLGWVLPQLWSIRQTYSSFAAADLTVLHLFSLACLMFTVFGWRMGVRSQSATPINDRLTDKSLVVICTILTVIVWIMVLGMGARALEERASATWSGPLTIMYFFSNLKILSFFLSIYLFLKHRSLFVVVLLIANIGLYAPTALLLFRRRAMLEAVLCIVLAFWFARRNIFPRIIIAAAMPVGMMVVFAIGSLRKLGEVSTGEAKWITIADIKAIDFWAATPFSNSANAPEMTNALNIVRLSSEYGVHSYGAASWNRIVFQWVPAQFVGADVKNALMFDQVDVAGQIAVAYNEAARFGSTPTAIGEAYLDFGFFGVMFFFATAYVVGRWWLAANRGSRTAMTLYTAGLATAVLMPTAYAIYFFNIMALYVGALMALTFAVAGQRKRGVKHRSRPARSASPSHQIG